MRMRYALTVKLRICKCAHSHVTVNIITCKSPIIPPPFGAL